MFSPNLGVKILMLSKKHLLGAERRKQTDSLFSSNLGVNFFITKDVSFHEKQLI